MISRRAVNLAGFGAGAAALAFAFHSQ